MKKKIGLIALFMFGLAVALWPICANSFYNRETGQLAKEYAEEVAAAGDFAELDALLRKENERMFNEKQAMFLNQEISYTVPVVDLQAYGLKDNIIGFIEIPSIEVNLPICLGASWENMKLGAVHLTGTSYPIGGENTNSVIAAHRGAYQTMFRHIDKIKLGDRLYIKNYNGTLVYAAARIEIIDPAEFDKITIQKGRDLVTIMSCHPFPFDYQRYVVFFERIEE